MSETLGLVSEVYQPSDPSYQVIDEPIGEHYQTWGYSIGYEFDTTGQPVPEGGNTAIFRIASEGLTEPVYVTKPEAGATFTVNVLDGEGTFIRARADGTVDQIPLTKGAEIIVHPGEAYSYANTGSSDLILHDVALPAFKAGDDADLTVSLVPEQRPEPKVGYSVCVVESAEGQRIIELPDTFFDAMSDAMK